MTSERCKHNWVPAEFFLVATETAFSAPICTLCKEDGLEIARLTHENQHTKARIRLCEIFFPTGAYLLEQYRAIETLWPRLGLTMPTLMLETRDRLDLRLKHALETNLEPEIFRLVWGCL